jgi:hypothetical protein
MKTVFVEISTQSILVAVLSMALGLRPLDFWDRGFKYR